MSQRAGSRGDRGKAPIMPHPRGDNSFNDETVSAGVQVARVL